MDEKTRDPSQNLAGEGWPTLPNCPPIGPFRNPRTPLHCSVHTGLIILPKSPAIQWWLKRKPLIPFSDFKPETESN